ncbi:ATP-binding protein [Corynebacterium variabile]|uniref:ATP-binding protein n=1 Tax=Corynebacterium variabile TaxID=1727 RepID=UPI002FE0702A
MTNPWAQWLRDNPQRIDNFGTKQGWDHFVHAAPREPLPRLTRPELRALDEEAFEDYNDARMLWHANPSIIKTPQVLHVFDVIDQVMASNGRDSDRVRGSVVIDAEAGVGKTTAAIQYARQFHRKTERRHGVLTPEGHQRLPVAFVQLKDVVTLKALNRAILNFYGHPAATRSNTSQLGDLAVDCVLSCRTQMIVLDDLHFIDFTERNGKQISNHLKGLANQMPVTFVYTGVDMRRRKFFDEGLDGTDIVYAQTSRRTTRADLGPFSIRDAEGATDWAKLLTSFEDQLHLAESHPGMLLSHAKLIHERTQGYIATLATLIERACFLAIRDGSERITEDILRDARLDNAADNAAAAAS